MVLLAGSDTGAVDLTNEELLKMVEQLNGELELRTQKKDRYKEKYLDEKQRAATMRDYYKVELERKKKDLDQARALLEGRVSGFGAGHAHGDHQSPQPHPGAIVYPPITKVRLKSAPSLSSLGGLKVYIIGEV